MQEAKTWQEHTLLLSSRRHGAQNQASIYELDWRAPPGKAPRKIILTNASRTNEYK